jgi:uncharacterized membrane protein YphA (DoxX/SURF4 family)
MNNLTRFLLVLLRLCIGWLFLFEGLDKVDTFFKWDLGNRQRWSSVGYLRQSSGPLKPFFQWQMGGDPDDKALAILALQPLPTGQDPAKITGKERIPLALSADWEAYVRCFSKNYGLDENQQKEAQIKLDQGLEKAATFLLGTEKEDEIKTIERGAEFPQAAFKQKTRFPQRVTEYQHQLGEARRLADQENSVLGKDVNRQKLRTAKAEAARLRVVLLTDLATPFLDSLKDILTPEQLKKGPPQPLPPPWTQGWTQEQVKFLQADSSLAPDWKLVWTDNFVGWGVFVIGVCLLLGLFTRLNCLAGAVFLLFLYVALPALPGLPENLKAEGDYLFVTKNLITAVALLALATTSSGRWCGLDGLVQFLNPWRGRKNSGLERELPR